MRTWALACIDGSAYSPAVCGAADWSALRMDAAEVNKSHCELDLGSCCPRTGKCCNSLCHCVSI